MLNDQYTNAPILQDYLSFISANRNGFSTTNALYFNTFGFTTSEIQISFERYINLSPNGNVDLSNLPQTTNIDLNANQGYFCVQNFTRPCVVKLCNIVGYESGVGRTVYTSSYSVNNKVLLNYSNPSLIYSIGASLSTSNLNISGYSSILSTSYIQNENFIYVTNGNLVFLATYQLGSFSWQPIPVEKFYYNVDYYITYTDVTFNGTFITFNQFKRIVPSINQLVLINCANFNDVLSGVYQIVNITNVINIQQYNLTANYPGQIFTANTNVDTYTGTLKNSVCYYVPFEYGAATSVFSKPLMLKQYIGLNSNINNFIPMYQDNVDNSILHLPLSIQNDNISKKSDLFKVGIFVSNWVPDNTFILGGLDYQIIEGN